jgi:hypothetical protein
VTSASTSPVVGGGIAGLSTAWKLARQGREVAVLEAGRLAAGVTARTTAKLIALYTLVYDHLRRTRGPEGARLYAHSQSAAIRTTTPCPSPHRSRPQPPHLRGHRLGGWGRRSPRRERSAPRGLGPLNPPRLHRGLQPCGTGMGMPVPRLPLRPGRTDPSGPRRTADGETRHLNDTAFHCRSRWEPGAHPIESLTQREVEAP